MITALSDLNVSTQEIRAVLQEIVASTTPLTLSDQKIQRANKLICNSVPVVLSGYLEAFLRDCSKRFMAKLEARGKVFSSLPLQMQRCHFSNGGRVLNKLTEGRISWVTCSPEDLVNRLANAVTAAACKPLWEAFGDTDANPSGKVIKRFLTDFGVTEPDKKVNAKATTGRDWSAFMNDLTVFMGARNQCAHSGQISNPPSPSSLIGDCDLVDELGLRIAQVLEDHIDAI